MDRIKNIDFTNFYTIILIIIFIPLFFGDVLIPKIDGSEYEVIDAVIVEYNWKAVGRSLSQEVIAKDQYGNEIKADCYLGDYIGKNIKLSVAIDGARKYGYRTNLGLNITYPILIIFVFLDVLYIVFYHPYRRRYYTDKDFLELKYKSDLSLSESMKKVSCNRTRRYKVDVTQVDDKMIRIIVVGYKGIHIWTMLKLRKTSSEILLDFSDENIIDLGIFTDKTYVLPVSMLDNIMKVYFGAKRIR